MRGIGRVIRRVGLLTVGGDTPALNASLESARKALQDLGVPKIYGFSGGYFGLITNRHCGNIVGTSIDPFKGGSFLTSLRISPLPSPEDKKKMEKMPDQERKNEETKWKTWLGGAIKTIEDLQIEALVVIGGDGTMRATAEFMEAIKERRINCKIIGLPRTIDNDLGTQTIHSINGKKLLVPLCPGYPSAARNIAILIRRLRTTAQSTRRIFVVEVMGRDAGWLTLASRWGWAEVQLVPEVNYVTEPTQNEENKEKAKQSGISVPEIEVPIEKVFEKIIQEYRHNNPPNLILVVCEGTFINAQQLKKTTYGPRKLTGIGDFLADLLMNYLKEKRSLDEEYYPNGSKEYPIVLRPEVRCQHGDYDPRIGPPSIYDLALAEVLAYYGLTQVFQEGLFGALPVLKEVYALEELQQAIAEKKARNLISFLGIPEAKFQPLLPEYYDLDSFTTTSAFDDFIAQILAREPEFCSRSF